MKKREWSSLSCCFFIRSPLDLGLVVMVGMRDDQGVSGRFVRLVNILTGRGATPGFPFLGRLLCCRVVVFLESWWWRVSCWMLFTHKARGSCWVAEEEVPLQKDIWSQDTVEEGKSYPRYRYLRSILQVVATEETSFWLKSSREIWEEDFLFWSDVVITICTMSWVTEQELPFNVTGWALRSHPWSPAYLTLPTKRS